MFKNLTLDQGALPLSLRLSILLGCNVGQVDKMAKSYFHPPYGGGSGAYQ